MRLAIITTHPIQYYAPVFQLLHAREKIEIHVFYTWGKGALNKYDPGFDKVIDWDIPLLDGYPYAWVQNTARQPGSHHFMGIVNPGLIDQVKSFQPDAVLFYGWAYHSHLKAIRHFKNKVPVLFRGDSTLLDERKGVKALLRSMLLKWIYRHVDHAFYTGTNNKAYFKRYGLKEQQLSFAPHAVDNDRFAADRSTEAKAVRQTAGIKDDELLLLFAGKLENKKAPLLLADAFITLKLPKMHLLFLGNGELEKELKSRSKDVANIHFMDFKNQADMPAMYQACDLFCLPSAGPGESWGLAVNEAMACGKAILVSDRVGCAADLVREGYNGAIFESGNMLKLIDSLKELTRSKKLTDEYGKNAAKLIKDWNFLKVAQAIENNMLNEIHSLS